MKKLIILLAFIACFLNAESQGRPIHGYYAQITIPVGDSICFPSMCVRAGQFGNKIFIEFDSIVETNVVKTGWDQTVGFNFNFKIFENYYGYGHYREPIPYPVSSFSVNYNVSSMKSNATRRNAWTFNLYPKPIPHISIYIVANPS